MTPTATITPGDSIDVMRTYPDNHFDSIDRATQVSQTHDHLF